MTNRTNKQLVLEAGYADDNYWSDVLRYRDIFIMLARRDLSVRYKQTAIGIIWALLRPALTMLVFTLVFGSIAEMPSGGAPYALLVLSGTLPWLFFSSSVSESSNSLVANSNLLSKAYFPRILLPASSILVAAVDLIIALGLLTCLMWYFSVPPTWRLLTIPLFSLVTFAAALGLGLWLSVLNARYRDFQFIVPFMLQIGLYISPVGYVSSAIPERWQTLFAINPMVGVIDGFRWAILGENFSVPWATIASSAAISIALLITGLSFFRHFERRLVDII